MRKIIYCLCVFACTSSACEKNNDTGSTDPKDSIAVKDVQIISDMSGDFGWRLFQEVAKGVTDKNVLISPLSVQTALTMAVNGADGTTREEMLTVLGCAGCNVKDLNEQTAKLRTMMEEQSGHPRLISANGFFFDPKRIAVLESFIETLTSDYKAEFKSYDFGDPFTVNGINSWVKDNTDGKIDKIVDEIGPDDLAFLINALHFKADWATGFDPSSTYPNTFTTSAKSEVNVDYVSADHEFSTVKKDSFNMVDLPFKDSTYSLSLLQPKGDLETQDDWFLQLKTTALLEMWNGLSYARAIVSFPKLNLEYKDELPEPLKRMGMIEAFSDSKADFSNLGHALIGPVIYISKVSHKAVLKVDEKGAEGAAVTSVGFSTTSAPPVFTFNKPFVIVLRHTQTNTILFAGLVNDPSK